MEQSGEDSVREAFFYNNINDLNDFLDSYSISCSDKCTDKHIKLFRSVINGNLTFVKKILNQGPIRNDHETMRAAINLACRFGQPNILEVLVLKAHEDFFRIMDLSFVVIIVASACEVRRLEANQQPSGVLDILVKYGAKSYDERKLEWMSGMIDFDGQVIMEGNKATTPFMKLCGIPNKHMEYVVRRITDANVADVNIVFGETATSPGASALTSAFLTGKKEVGKIILDKMIWKGVKDLVEFDQNHIQRVLGSLIGTSHLLSVKTWERVDPVDWMDIIKFLIEKCFRVTEENKIGHDNDTFMASNRSRFYHDHFDAMIFQEIEEERRIAHVSGKHTWYDFDTKKFAALMQVDALVDAIGGCNDLSPMKRKKLGSELQKTRSTIQNFGSGLQIEFPTQKKMTCWTCGQHDLDLMVCKQCRKARYCDALCQEENWANHQEWCQEQKDEVEREREGETEGHKEWRKASRKLNKQMKQFRCETQLEGYY